MVNSDPAKQQHYENLLANYLDLSGNLYLKPTQQALDHMRKTIEMNENQDELYNFEEKLKLMQDVFSQSFELTHQKRNGKIPIFKLK